MFLRVAPREIHEILEYTENVIWDVFRSDIHLSEWMRHVTGDNNRNIRRFSMLINVEKIAWLTIV